MDPSRSGSRASGGPVHPDNGLAEGCLPYLPSLEDFNSIDVESEMANGGIL